MCRCGSGKRSLCPVSFGLALGITSAIAIFIWTLWMVYRGVPPSMAQYIPANMVSFSGSLILALFAFIKGFIFGFVLILFYDLFVCCCKARCCKPNAEGTCGCGCKCCGPDKLEGRNRNREVLNKKF